MTSTSEPSCHTCPVEVLCGDAASFDPLKQLSPLETIDPATLSPDALPPGVLPSWQQEVMHRCLAATLASVHIQWLLSFCRLQEGCRALRGRHRW